MSQTDANPALGLTLKPDGGHIRVYSRHAERLFFCLLDGPEIELSREGDIHSGFIPGLKEGQAYGLRAEGTYDQHQGLLFDRSKLLVDPYARHLNKAYAWHEDMAKRGAETAQLVPHGVVSIDPPPLKRLFPPKRPKFIYEIAVKAFTKLHPAIPPEQRGTVAALRHPAIIEHLLKLGVDTVELMPVMAWADEHHLKDLGLTNSWGYNPYSYFAPDPRLAPDGMAEIRETVAALHEAGLMVLLDVVYNHTGESDLGGPTLSFRGLDNPSYYRLHEGQLINDTGCGNTLATTEPIVVQLIRDSLRYWADIGGVDGFRYDLATVLGREAQGFTPQAPLFQAIAADPVLAQLTHIAEPWDIGPGGYQLGNFPQSWCEWSDRYRDEVRRYWRGDSGLLGSFITRLAGSADIFQPHGRPPSASVNFISAHDGFTLHDTVSYNAKQNFANGEDNRDGNSHEPSWVASDVSRDARALLSSLMLSRGTLMITAGDEFGRTQKGNNNAYAQDNDYTWLNWEKADQGLIAHVAGLAKLRRDHPSFFADRYFTGKAVDERGLADVLWVNRSGQPIDWNHPDEALFGMMLASPEESIRLLAMFNRGGDELDFTPPEPQAGYRWRAYDDGADMGKCPARSVRLFREELLAQRSSQGADDQMIQQLAKAAQIQLEWYEVNGTHHQVRPDSLRAILKALNIAHNNVGEVQASLAQLAQFKRQKRFYHLKPDQAFMLSLLEKNLPDRLILREENGEQKDLSQWNGRCLIPPLPQGLYRLYDEGHKISPLTLVVNDGQAYVPEALIEGQRRFGLNAHLYALRDKADCGIGDFATLAGFGAAAAQMRAVTVGLNPLHCLFTDDRERASPYQPSDRRFVDPIYIDLRALRQRYGVSADTTMLAHEAELRDKTHVDYVEVWRYKDKVLRQIFAQSRYEADASFLKFVREGGSPLQSHAAYESRFDPTRYDYAMWLQWMADQQLQEAAARSAEKGLSFGLYRDLALGCAYEGGEVWSQPELFATDLSLGAPPDPFAKDGQVWNLPPFNPFALAQADYQPLRDILSANMRHAGMLRIDHVLGLARQFFVPRGGSGEFGAYFTMPMEDLLALITHESLKAKCLIVGEDLGTVPEGFREKMTAARLLSYRVLWFEQNEAGFLPPQSYPPQSLACLSSHDLPPFKAWEEQAPADERAKFSSALQQADAATGDLLADAHDFLARSASALMLVQADDLTEEIEPLNVPGTDKERPNWRRRLSQPVEALAELDTSQRIGKRLNAEGRLS